MSDPRKGNRKSAASAVAATVIVAIAAVAAIVVLIMMSKKDGGSEQSGSGSTVIEFKPTQEFADECGKNAQELVAGNYKIVRLFVSEGLARRNEPYGNRPEDGFYTVISDEYTTFEQIESLVKSVFTEEEANRILTRMPSDPAAQQGGAADTSDHTASSNSGDVTRPETIAVYGSRDVYVDADGVLEDGTSAYVKKSVLGINEYFKPYTDYRKPWGSISIKIAPVSETECGVTVYLGSDKDVDLSSVEDTDILNTKMVKENGEWRLTELIY